MPKASMSSIAVTKMKLSAARRIEALLPSALAARMQRMLAWFDLSWPAR